MNDTLIFNENTNKKDIMRTYRDSYFYNQSGKKGENLMKKHDQMLINYIMKADRIDKHDPAFAGILESVKRQQTSSILYSILMLDNVILCTAAEELPPAFKVFDAYDLRSENKQPSVFIDCTKMFTISNGYYNCKNTAKLVSYLMAAMVYLSYRKDTLKVVSNNAILISGTECYVNMFSFVIDYLRPIGYAAKRDQIGYLIGLFFLVNMMGKELDTYTKNLASKAAKLNSLTIQSMDLYIEDGLFDDINTFVTGIATMFKLEGFTTEVFIQKWIYLFGNGTQYGTELFTSFAVILSYTFCGSYILNQKQIEKCCGTSMVKFCNAYITIGTELFDKRMYMDATELEKLQPRDYATQALAESIRLGKAPKPDNIKLVKEDFASVGAISKKIDDAIEYNLRIFDGQEKLSSVFETAIKMALTSMDCTTAGRKEFLYENGVLTELIKKGSKFINESAKRDINSAMRRKSEAYSEAMRNYRDDNPKLAKNYGVGIKELRECINML